MEDLPLVAGANQWELIATDAAGNVSRTNLSVVQSSVTLTIDYTPTGESLYDPTGTVYGNVSEADYTVIVNGVAAEVYESGYWYAQNVPNRGQGTATFDVVATLASGGGSGGNPAVSVSEQKEVPAKVALTEHHSKWSVTSPGVKHTWTKHFRGGWGPELDGSATWKYQATATHKGETDTGWWLETYRWSDADSSGTVESEGTSGSTGPGPIPAADSWIKNVPEASRDHYEWTYTGGTWRYVWQYFAKGVRHPWPNGDGTETVVVCTAETKETLYTGGKASSGSKNKNLYCLTASATEYKGRPYGAPWAYTQGYQVEADKIAVNGKAVGNDSRLYVALSDNKPEDVTVNVKGAEHFSAGVSASKHKLKIIVNGSCPLAEDRVVTCADFCVGQKLNFEAIFVPPVTGLAQANPRWIFPGSYINYHFTDSNDCERYLVGSYWHTQNPTRAWYYDRVEGMGVSVGLYCHFENGQTAYPTTQGKINVYRPKVVGFLPSGLGEPPRPPYITNRTESGATVFGIGDSEGGGFMVYSVAISSRFRGEGNITQLIKAERVRDKFLGGWESASTDGRFDLDTSEWYFDPHDLVVASEQPASGLTPFTDGPVYQRGSSQTMVEDSFKDYIRFRPDGSEAIWVTLGRIDWSWSGSESAAGGWEPAGTITGPELKESTSFPVWSDVFP